MSLAETLRARAEASGHTIKQLNPEASASAPQKVEDKSAFAALLGARAKESGQKVINPASQTLVTKDKASFAAALKKRTEERDPNKIDTDFETGDVPVWSFSTLKQYENCPYSLYLAKIERKPQQTSAAAARGSMLHEKAEHFVRGEDEKLAPELSKHFNRDFMELRELYDQNLVTVEEDWGIRKDWSPCTWQDDELWGRAKLDVFVKEDSSCRIIDHKSGKKWGNELKHSDQGISYALHTFHRFPEIELFRVEFWYLDHGDKLLRNFTRSQLKILLPRYHKRAMGMTTARDWPAKPSCQNCKFCPYSNGRFGTGDCEYAE